MDKSNRLQPPLPLITFKQKDRILKTFKKNPNDKEEIEERRRYIYQYIAGLMDNKVNRIDSWRNSDLSTAIRLYDELFLGNCISKLGYKGDKEFKSSFDEFEEYDRHIPGRVRLNKEWDKLHLTIFKYPFRDNFEKRVSNTSRCYDRLECMLQTLEHELIHVVIDMYEEDLSKVERKSLRVDAHSSLFGDYLKAIFGTNIVLSYLLLDVDIYENREEYIMENISVGDKVKILGRAGLRTISKIYTNRNKERVIEIEEKKGEQIPLQLVDIENNERKTKDKKVFLSPISMKGNRG